jgi:O-succinylbenzoic acid--CoA ligase
VPGTEVRVVSADGEPLPHGSAGVVEVRGPTLFAGYLDDDDATRRALRAGWLRTGDLGTLDARGRLTIHARRLDLIVTGGENVYPAEVEATLLTHPAITEAAVLGEADPTWGQRVVAAVVLRAPATPEEVGAYCRARLASFKVPRVVHVLATLPRTPVGKVDRRALRAALGLAPLDVG